MSSSTSFVATTWYSLQILDESTVYLVGIHSHAKETGVGVDELVDVADPQVPQHGGVVQVGQVGHVVAAVELGRVDLPHLVLLEHLLLPA
jgi:hypothetical protein